MSLSAFANFLYLFYRPFLKCWCSQVSMCGHPLSPCCSFKFSTAPLHIHWWFPNPYCRSKYQPFKSPYVVNLPVWTPFKRTHSSLPGATVFAPAFACIMVTLSQQPVLPVLPSSNSLHIMARLIWLKCKLNSWVFLFNSL